ncbi:hypothetical protein [Nonomuraea sp. NPDC048826]|uniref:hypothetical protein n=1 Tax=Nonomuraea sp. NPDC048826 TaxID=3364347 RepID=UPI003710B902
MDSALEILLFLIGVSLGLFVLISLLVFIPGRGAARKAEAGPVWIGGPGRTDRGVSTSGLVLVDRPPRWAPPGEIDWVAAAETAEPGRRVGGASAGW